MKARKSSPLSYEYTTNFFFCATNINLSLHATPLLHHCRSLQEKHAHKVAPTILAQASVLKDFGRSIGAPTARSMIS